MDQNQYIPRDLSWLSFNHRVLQEAADPHVPLYERLKFLAIYSSNLDEFVRVRVASLRSFKQLKKKTREKLEINPKKALKEIQQVILEQQELFGDIFRNQIIPALEDQQIFLLNDQTFHLAHITWARAYFQQHVQPLIKPMWINADQPSPFLRNKALYLIIHFAENERDLAIVEIPSQELDRFILLPGETAPYYVAFLDDLIRINLTDLFPEKTILGAYAIKLSRDAEMYIDDEFSGNLLDKIRKGLSERDLGLPTRFLYDQSMPEEVLLLIQEIFRLRNNDLVLGARYHNFHDFHGFPKPVKDSRLEDRPLPPLNHPSLQGASSILALIQQKDRLLHFPYQKYDYLLRLLDEAIASEEITTIKITLYRVAAKSMITQKLLEAMQQGKRVVVFIEVKARFDEATNLYWGQVLQDQGAKVIYSYPGIKVHTKLLLLEGPKRAYAYVGTGNFNEKTARIYADHAVLTVDPEITEEVGQVFELLEGRLLFPQTKELLIAPYNLRSRFTEMIDREIALAQAGKEAYMILKMNSLEDRGMIDKIYEAAAAGVRISLIVRGIFCLDMSSSACQNNIHAISIVDRFLEHARIYLFGNGGKEKMYLSSADWMTRNLDRRIEVAVPIKDQEVFMQLRTLLNAQLQDTTKARLLTSNLDNPLVGRTLDTPHVRAQEDYYDYLKGLLRAYA